MAMNILHHCLKWRDEYWWQTYTWLTDWLIWLTVWRYTKFILWFYYKNESAFKYQILFSYFNCSGGSSYVGLNGDDEKSILLMILAPFALAVIPSDWHPLPHDGLGKRTRHTVRAIVHSFCIFCLWLLAERVRGAENGLIVSIVAHRLSTSSNHLSSHRTIAQSPPFLSRQSRVHYISIIVFV